MTALRKPDYLTGGYKMAYLKMMACHLTGDQHKLLFLLVDHISFQGCFPSLETLAREAGWSVTKVRRIRDRLAEMDAISYISGTGHISTRYSIPGLPLHTASMKEKKAPKAPESGGGGAPQADTETLNPSLKKKEEGRPDLRIVPTTGWQALKALADDHTRRFWLDPLVFLGTDASGVMVFSTGNPAIGARVREMLDDARQLGDLARKVGVDPAKVAIRTAKHGVDPVPADLRTMPTTPRGLDEKAQEIEDRQDRPEPPVLSGNAVSLAAYKTKRQDDAAREHEDDGGLPVDDTEVARPERDRARQEHPPLDGGRGPGPGGPGPEDPGDRGGV